MAEAVDEKKNFNEVIPTELISVILHQAVNTSHKVMRPVCSFVCKLWADLLRRKKKKRFPKRTKDASKSFTSKIAMMGWMSLLQWAQGMGSELNDHVCHFAAQNGDIAMLEWAKENGCGWTAFTTQHAATSGHLHVLKWLRDRYCLWNHNVMEN